MAGDDNSWSFFFFFQAEDGIRDLTVTGVQTCALPICASSRPRSGATPTGTPSRIPETIRKLPWLTPARSLPLGASSARTAAGTELMPGILAAADLAAFGEIFRAAAAFQALRRRAGAAGASRRP